MNTIDIYNASRVAAQELSDFLRTRKYTPEQIVGALLINFTSIQRDGKIIDANFACLLVSDFIAIRDNMSKNGDS